MAERALIAAPTGRDAALLRQLFLDEGLQAEALATVPALCERIDDEVLAVIIASEALDEVARLALQQVLARQPAWSDLPIVLLLGAGADAAMASGGLEDLGYVLTVDRPTRRASLLATVRAAVRSRRRQYERREYLASLRRLAHELHESQEELRVAFDQAPHGAALCGVDGTITRVNASFAELFGRSAESLVGVGFAGLLPKEEAARCAEPWQRVLRGEPEDLEVTTPEPGRTLHVWLSRLDDERGQARRVSLLVFDVTERKRAELERQRLQEQLLAAQRLETVGRLAGGIAHEFNNMLAIILNYTSIAASRPAADASVRADLEQVLIASRRCVELTRSMMMSGQRDMAVPERVQVNPVVARVTRLVHTSFGSGVDLRIELDPELPDVCMPTVHLDQLVSHLVRNALEALGGEGRLRVSTRTVGSTVHVLVEDDGPGMTDEVRAVAVEPFFTTKEVGGGPGLGLSIVQGVVTAAGGELRIETAPGEGTRVDVALPAAQVAVEEAPSRPASPSAAPGRVLVVDDEPALVALMAELLGDAGLEVVTAGSAAAALERLREGDVDVLVTDVLMPGGSGPQLALELRRRLPAAGVVFVSGYPAEHYQITLPGRHWAFVQKPFTQEALVAAIYEVTRGVEEERPDSTSPRL